MKTREHKNIKTNCFNVFMNNSPVKLWRNQKHVRALLGKRGTIMTYTVIRVPPAGYEGQAPYPVVLVQLENRGHAVGQLVDYEHKHIKIGQSVISVLRRVKSPDNEGVIPYGIKFKPI